MNARSEALQALFDGATHANFTAPWGSPAPCELPADPDERRQLLVAHLQGQPATVDYAKRGQPPRPEQVERLELAALTPAPDGRCRWCAADLDAADGHGVGGLVDPDAAARCIAERAEALGLGDGLLIVPSRSGVGRHVWFLFAEPIPLADAAVLVAYLAACARRVADRDAGDTGRPHAFRRADGGVAEPGRTGCFELLPRSQTAPARGYPLAAPFAGGGDALNVFADPVRPISLTRVPQCDSTAVAMVLAEARRELAARTRPKCSVRRRAQPKATSRRLDSRTMALLDGRTSEGERNKALFYAAGDLMRAGATEAETERLLLTAAERVGLAPREARATVTSGLRRAREQL